MSSVCRNLRDRRSPVNVNLPDERAVVRSLTLRRPQRYAEKMIISVGVDLVEVERIRVALESPRTGLRFRSRVYTEEEIAYCEKKQRGRFESYAGRFAAKEAVMKALGRGWGAQVRWLDIEVARTRSGKPEIVLYNKTALLAQQLGIRSWALSITHTAQHGLAYVIAQNA